MADAKAPSGITLSTIRSTLFSAVISDALDMLGYTRQSPGVELRPFAGEGVLAGRVRTTLWADMAHEDPRPYDLELAAVDACRAGDVLVAAAGGSLRSGIWGELLSTAARNSGCEGAIIDGAVRDVRRIRAMEFPVFARGTSVYDSKNRQRVTDIDVPVEIGGVLFSPGELVVADEDGVVVVPRDVEADVLRKAWEKVCGENRTRDAIRDGMKAVEAYKKFGIL